MIDNGSKNKQDNIAKLGSNAGTEELYETIRNRTQMNTESLWSSKKMIALQLTTLLAQQSSEAKLHEAFLPLDAL